MEGEALKNNPIVMKLKGAFNVLAVKIPGFTHKKEWLDDIALITGASIVNAVQPKLENATLGLAKKLTAKEKSTLLVGTQDISSKIEELKALKENSQSNYEKDKFTGRIAILSGKVATIKTGAAIDSDLKYLKLKIEDGVNEAKRALEEGIIPGGDVSFINASKTLKHKCYKWWTFKSNTEEAIGYDIVLDSIHLPLEQIIKNGYQNPKKVLKIIRNSNSLTIGYDAMKNEIVPNMITCGIIDAVKVARTVLEKATIGAAKYAALARTITNEKDESVKPNIEY